jgi:hypothetical protein
VTTALPEGAEVSPRRYLADTSAAAEAIADFSRALEAVGPVATRAALREAAPALREPLERAAAIAQRLEDQRLEDQRLEAQRERAAAALPRVVAAMRLTTDAAADGNPRRAVAAAADFAQAVEALRSLPPVPDGP